MTLELKLLSGINTEEFVQLLKIFGNVFGVDNLKVLDNDYLQTLLQKPDFKVFVAKHDRKVVGGVTVYILHNYYSAKPTAYIYDVGVMPAYQRKGIGGKLMSYLIRYCKENGFEEVYVEAESDDIQAVNFYCKTNPTSILKATQFTYMLGYKEIE